MEHLLIIFNYIVIKLPEGIPYRFSQYSMDWIKGKFTGLSPI